MRNQFKDIEERDFSIFPYFLLFLSLYLFLLFLFLDHFLLLFQVLFPTSLTQSFNDLIVYSVYSLLYSRLGS